MADDLAHRAAAIMDPVAWDPRVKPENMGQIWDQTWRQMGTLDHARKLIAAGMLVDHIEQGDTND